MNFLKNKKKLFPIILVTLFVIFILTNATYGVTSQSSKIETVATYNGPYECPDTTATIRAWTNGSVSNVTLYYRYSPDNISGWSPGADYVNLTLADVVCKSQDTDMRYPQRLWFDEKNQLMYIACRVSHTLQIYDVSKHWNLTKITQLKDTKNLTYIHDIKVINNWSFNGINYGDVLLTTAGNKQTKLLTLSVNLCIMPKILDSKIINSGYKTLGYLNYFINDTGNLIVVVAEQSPTARFTIFDASNPTDILNLSETQVGKKTSAVIMDPTFDKNHQHLYIQQGSTNTTVKIFDISNLRKPSYVGYQLPGRPLNRTNIMYFRFPYGGHDDWMITMNGTVANNDCQLTVLNMSDPLNWTIISDVDANGTGEFQADYYGEWAAVRYRNGRSNNSGLTVFNIADIYNMFQAGYYTNPNITVSAHMQWVDTNRSRIFASSYTSNAFYALNMTRNLSHAGSWYAYEDNINEPFEWEFDFPNGTGYYEFITRGSDEDYHATADCRIFSTSEPHPPPTIPTISGPLAGNQEKIYRYTIVSTGENNDMIQYIIDWGDTTTDTSEFLPNGTIYVINHSWMDAGVYHISCNAYNSYTKSKSTYLTVSIDVQYCDDIGYLIDNESDETYDLFYCNKTENITIVGQKGETYLIDTDGDGTWEYSYNSTAGMTEIQYIEKRETPGFELILIIYAVSLIALFKRNRKRIFY